MGLMRCAADAVISGPLTPDKTAWAEHDVQKRFLAAASVGAIVWPSIVGRWEPVPTWGAETYRYTLSGCVVHA
jgi:hypothetical protein